MKLAYRVGLAYGIAELVYQVLKWRRYSYFDSLRIACDVTSDEIWKMIRTIMQKNPLLLARCQLSQYTRHIRNEKDVYNALTSHVYEMPVNQLQVGCSKLYWQYEPLLLNMFMKSLRQLGNLYMRYKLGFVRKWHKTDDGYYSVWTHTVDGTKPFVLFPGLGLGASLYARFAKSFGRTVHIIEVPNMSYPLTLSSSHATSETIYEIVSKYVEDGPDIIGHSLGTIHTAMYLNSIHNRDTPKHNVILCEGFVNVCDTIHTHIYPFVGHGDFSSIRKKPKYQIYFNAFLYMAIHSLESQIFTKRFHTFYHGTLWRDYPNATINHVYTKYDILYDTDYITNNSQCMYIPKGSHGYSVFGKFDIARYHELLGI